jgi:hypothetical protein
MPKEIATTSREILPENHLQLIVADPTYVVSSASPAKLITRIVPPLAARGPPLAGRTLRTTFFLTLRFPRLEVFAFPRLGLPSVATMVKLEFLEET